MLLSVTGIKAPMYLNGLVRREYYEKWLRPKSRANFIEHDTQPMRSRLSGLHPSIDIFLNMPRLGIGTKSLATRETAACSRLCEVGTGSWQHEALMNGQIER